MLKYTVLACGYAFAAAVQPGPLQAFLVSRAAANGWRRTLPACLSPLLSDGPVALVALVLLGKLPVLAQDVLRAAGGLLLIYLAWVAFRQWKAPAEPGSIRTAPRTLLDAALVNLLNPNPYLGWALVLGPLVVAAWSENPSYAVALVAGFYGTLIAMLAATILLAGTAHLLSLRTQRTLVGTSVALLGAIGIFLLVTGVSGILTA
jgi:threonine/homoserine/homoserine lactone efflux protein